MNVTNSGGGLVAQNPSIPTRAARGRSRQPDNGHIGAHRRARPGLTLVELLVVIAIIAGLVAVLLPAVQAARESARSAECGNNLRQLALGVLQYTETEGFLPPGRDRGLSWVVHVLPFIEQQALFEKFTFGDQAVFYSPVNADPRNKPLPMMCCPTRRSSSQPSREPQGTGASGDYAGNAGSGNPPARDGVIHEHRVNGVGEIIGEIRLAGILDGLGSTLLVGEKHVRRGFVAPPVDASPYNGAEVLFSARYAGPSWPLAVADEQQDVFGSWHQSGVPFSMCDASVRRISESIDPGVLVLLAIRNDRQPIPVDY